MLLAAAAIAITPFLAEPLLERRRRRVRRTPRWARSSGSFFAAMAIFSVPITLLGHGVAVRRPAGRGERREGGRGGRQDVRAVHGGQHPRHVHPGRRADPADRHAADDARDRRAAGAGRRAGAGPPLRARARRDRRAGAAAARPGQARQRRDLRDRVAVPVHPGRAAQRRLADPAPERGLGRALGVAAEHRADRRLLGPVPAGAADPRRPDPEPGDGRVRGRHGRPRLRPGLAAT